MADYEALAKQKYSKHSQNYYNSGANDEVSLRTQFSDFDRIKLKYRTFTNPSMFKDTKTDLLGKQIESPICVTSTAFQRMGFPEGEVATARACNNKRTPFVLSSWATSSNEEVGEAAPDVQKIYQIYITKPPVDNLDIWKRVKNSGFCAYALTCDTQLLGKRLQDTRYKFSLPPHLRMENFVKYMPKSDESSEVKGQKASGLAEFVKKC